VEQLGKLQTDNLELQSLLKSSFLTTRSLKLSLQAAKDDVTTATTNAAILQSQNEEIKKEADDLAKKYEEQRLYTKIGVGVGVLGFIAVIVLSIIK
jgi:hypothetical protein